VTSLMVFDLPLASRFPMIFCVEPLAQFLYRLQFENLSGAYYRQRPFPGFVAGERLDFRRPGLHRLCSRTITACIMDRNLWFAHPMVYQDQRKRVLASSQVDAGSDPCARTGAGARFLPDYGKFHETWFDVPAGFVPHPFSR
jgi:hypothetical protein